MPFALHGGMRTQKEPAEILDRLLERGVRIRPVAFGKVIRLVRVERARVETEEPLDQVPDYPEAA